MGAEVATYSLIGIIAFLFFYNYVNGAFEIKRPADYKTKSDPPPPAGARIRLTWLPYNNAYPEPNCYIGSEGIVTQLDTEDGSFVLEMESGAGLVVGNHRGRHGNGYTYILI